MIKRETKDREVLRNLENVLGKILDTVTKLKCKEYLRQRRTG